MLNTVQVEEITPEEVVRMGKEWFNFMLENTPADEVLSHYKPEQRLAGLTEEKTAFIRNGSNSQKNRIN
ncbi:hypothetical protein CCP3SC1_550016 [Gammaproteobacteria bacterium]